MRCLYCVFVYRIFIDNNCYSSPSVTSKVTEKKQNKNIYKKALSFISLFIFYIGLLYELFFIILYSFLYCGL